MLSVYAGSEIQLVGTFVNHLGSLANPTTATFYLQPPTGTEVAIVATNLSTGVYACNINTTGYEAGVYTYRLEGTGSLVAAQESVFELRGSEVR